MIKIGIVTEYLRNLLAKQVNDNGLVVWYDPDGVYADVVPSLNLPDTDVLCYQGSFIELRWKIDQRHLMDGEEPPRLVVYIPMAQQDTHHALIELEVAGVVMQPGQQPPARNTRLAVMARNALKGVLSEDASVYVEKQVEAGRLTLADLDALADKGGEISKGVIALIFGTGNPQEIALLFLDNDRLDESITKKDAKGELVELLRRDFGFDAPDGTELDDIRQRLARHVLMTDLVSGLGRTAPSSLATAPVASTPAATAACLELARAWRLRRDRRDSYVVAALRVEQEFNLTALTFDPEAIVNIETFPAIERVLLRHAENRLLEQTDDNILVLAESRKAGFWCDAEPKLQARWALVAAATEVLLEAERVEKMLKKSPQSITGMIKEYAEGEKPWCLLDTQYRHMESRWYNLEPHGDDHDSIEKLVIQARRRYVAVGSEVARQFLTQLQKTTPDKSVVRQREVFENHVKPFLAEKKTAYVWVDALRFEMGRGAGPLAQGRFRGGPPSGPRGRTYCNRDWYGGPAARRSGRGKGRDVRQRKAGAGDQRDRH